MDRFLIIRLSSLGDIIHTLPAFAALRRHFPEARITWVVERPGKTILDHVPGIDDIVVRGTPGWIRRIRNRDQVAMDFQGLVKSGLVAFLSRARTRIGFGRDNLKEKASSLFYTDRLEKIPEDGHVIGKNLRLLSKLGIRDDAYEFPLRLPEDLRQSVRNRLAGLGFPAGKKLVVCNVGAAWETKRWPAEGWIRLLGGLNRPEAFPVLLWGNAEEKKLAEAVHRTSGAAVAPFLAVPETMALIQAAALVVSGDTFALQAACALSVPVVGIFGPTNPRRNGPFRPLDRVVYLAAECAPCYQRTCAAVRCLLDISPDEVARSVRELLDASE